MPRTTRGRMTQRRIAELAGVSQATVSLVLNGIEGNGVRIPEETRQRVLDVINETTYVPDPAARRLAGGGNKMLGVFTYESAFPVESFDFYTPLLTGIEAGAEHLGCDLIMFTSAPVERGRRHIYHSNNRLGLADGCLLLGREIDSDDLVRLVEDDYPFVAIGRRDIEGVAYVGVDYVTATASLARRALQLGHDHFVYLHVDSEGESTRDRRLGLESALPKGVEYHPLASDGTGIASDAARIRDLAPSVLFVEDAPLAEPLVAALSRLGVSVPRDLSMVVLGETAPDEEALDFTRLSPPRAELGRAAITLLDRILDPVDRPGRRILLDCPTVAGVTLTAPGASDSSDRTPRTAASRGIDQGKAAL